MFIEIVMVGALSAIVAGRAVGLFHGRVQSERAEGWGPGPQSTQRVPFRTSSERASGWPSGSAKAADTSVRIQRQNPGSNDWMTLSTIPENVPNVVLQRMEEQKRNYPASRVRAIDARGALVDMIP